MEIIAQNPGEQREQKEQSEQLIREQQKVTQEDGGFPPKMKLISFLDNSETLQSVIDKILSKALKWEEIDLTSFSPETFAEKRDCLYHDINKIEQKEIVYIRDIFQREENFNGKLGLFFIIDLLISIGIALFVIISKF